MSDSRVFKQNKRKVFMILCMYCFLVIGLTVLLKRAEVLCMLIVGFIWFLLWYNLKISIDGKGITSKNLWLSRKLAWEEIGLFRYHAADADSDELFLVDGESNYIRFNKTLQNYEELVGIIVKYANNAQIQLDDYYKEERLIHG